MNEFSEHFEIIPGQFYFCTKDKERNLSQSNKFLYFTTDTTLQYTPFFADFGPLHLGLTYNFCEQLDTLLTQGSVEKKPVIYYSTTHPHHRANSAVLICAYMIFVKGVTAEIAYQPFIGVTPMLTTFRDAAFAINTYPLTVLDCCRAFYRVHCLRHFVYSSFDIFKHDHLSKLENGDISWIIPGKFIAFSGPVSTPREVAPGVFALSPEGYVPLFKSLGVTCIIRFNKKCYDRNIFIRSGIKHVDLYYEDGGNPTEAILQAFLSTCENERGSIAVHCKAGLGRTGTNIAAYMMKHYGYSAKEATAWCRVCRPGCVVGPQQQYLETIQEQMWQEGRRYRQERQSQGQGQGSNPNSSRGPALLHKSAGAPRHAQNHSEMIDSSQQQAVEHVDSSVTSRILKNQQHFASLQARGGGGGGRRPMNGSTAAAAASGTDRERTPSITSRPNTSSGLDNIANENRDGRRDSRNSRKGSGNIDWSLQHETKQLTITTSSSSMSSSSRPKTSSYSETDVTRSVSGAGGGGGGNGTGKAGGGGGSRHPPATLNDLNEKKQSFLSTTTTTTVSASNGSSRSIGSNSSSGQYSQTQQQQTPPIEDKSSSASASASSPLTRMLWSSTKSKLKPSSVSPTTATAVANTPQSANTRSLNSREGSSSGNPRKGSFGKTNVANASLGMKKLSTK